MLKASVFFDMISLCHRLRSSSSFAIRAGGVPSTSRNQSVGGRSSATSSAQTSIVFLPRTSGARPISARPAPRARGGAAHGTLTSSPPQVSTTCRAQALSRSRSAGSSSLPEPRLCASRTPRLGAWSSTTRRDRSSLRLTTSPMTSRRLYTPPSTLPGQAPRPLPCGGSGTHSTDLDPVPSSRSLAVTTSRRPSQGASRRSAPWRPRDGDL